MNVRFKALDELIAAKQIGQSKIQTRPSWYIPATDKMRPLQQSIDRTIRQTRATQRPFLQHEPVKRTTVQASREKIRAEAHTKRERVPSQYRPKTHEPERPKRKDKVFFKDLERERAKRTADRQEESLRSKFNAQIEPPVEAKPAPKIVKNEDFINRTKERAEKLRETIPPKYRAKPYETGKTPQKPSKTVKEGPKETIKDDFQTPTQETVRPKMSQKFNEASTPNGTKMTIEKKLDLNAD